MPLLNDFYSIIPLSICFFLVFDNFKLTQANALCSNPDRSRGSASQLTASVRPLLRSCAYKIHLFVDSVQVKDLGPQFKWRTVYLVEYTGPFLLYLFFYSQPSLIYGADATIPTLAQTYSNTLSLPN